MSHPQDPSRVKIINGVEYVVDKRGRPRFYTDGTSVRENGQKQCKAKSHWSGYRCVRHCTTTYPVCQQHGSGSPKKGRAGGRPVESGIYSNDLPTDLGARNEIALNNPNLMSLRDQIALMQVRITKLISQLPREDEVAVSIKDLIEGAQMYSTGVETDDERMQVRGLGKLQGAVGTVEADIIQWDSIVDLMERQSKLMNQEAKLRKSLRAMLSVEEATAMILLLKTIINEYIKDPQIKTKIAQELRKYFDVSEKPTPVGLQKPMVIDG